MTNTEIGKRLNEWRTQMICENAGCGTPMIAAILIMIVLLFGSCATKTKIEFRDREVVKVQKQVVHDTLLQHTHDSTYHTVFQKGDTVYDTKYVEKTKWRDRIVVKTDTCYRDSIQTQIKETVVEKTKVPKWAYYCLGICILFIIIAILKLIRWLRAR